MLSIATIQSAVSALLKGRYPGETVYQDLVPTGFAHPSFLVECGPVKITDASCLGLDISVTVTVTAYAAIDEYHDSDIPELQTRMMAVLALFATGYLAAGGRALHVTASEGSYTTECAVIKATLSYADDRPGEEARELMGAVHNTIQIKEEK